MDFEFTEEQKSLAALVTDFLKQETSPKFMKQLVSTGLKDPAHRGFFKKAQDVGLLTLTVPERYGGGGFGIGSLLTQVMLAERVEQFAGGLGLMTWIHWKLCSDLAAVGTKEQQDEFFPQIMNDPTFSLGEVISELEHGMDARLPYDEPGVCLKTFAYRDGDDYVINGEKWPTDSVGADLFFLYVRTDKSKPMSQAVSAFLVPRNTPGCSVTRIDEIMGELIRPIGELRFENCRIPARYLVGEEGKGWGIFNGRYGCWIGSSGAQVGAAQAIFDFSRDFAKTRVQGGKPIFEHLTIGTRLVEMLSNIEQIRLLAYKTAWEYDRTGNTLLDPLKFCLCNAAAKDLGVLIAGYIAEIFASRAVLKDLPVEAYIRGTYCNLHGFDTPVFNRIRAMKML